MNAWPIAIQFTLRHETGGDMTGAYHVDPNDPGGATKWGISQRAHPKVDVKNLTMADALAIYRAGYWNKIKGDALPAPLAVALFDFSVVHGVPVAAKRLQRLVGAKPDGDIGKNSLAAIAKKNGRNLAVSLCMARGQALASIVKAKPSQARYLGGWIVRLVDLTSVVSKLVG